MKRRNAEILLAAVIVARSTSLLFARIGLASMDPLNLLGLRFTLAFLVLALLFGKRLLRLTRTDWACGLALGAAFFLVMAAEIYTLKYTDASTTSFLENTAIVIVPLLQALWLRKKPAKRVLLSALITLLGVALLTLRMGPGLGFGEMLGMLTALLYACAILLTDRLSRRGDALMMGVIQVGCMGVLFLVASLFFETPRLPASPAEWMVVFALSLVCSCFGFTLQPLAQKHTSAARTAQFCALNPLATALMGALFMRERLGLAGLFGAALILAGILVQAAKKGMPGNELREADSLS